MLSGGKATEFNLRAALQQERKGTSITFYIWQRTASWTSETTIYSVRSLSPEPNARTADRDGWLMLHEIYSLSLAGCDLAVLSAARRASDLNNRWKPAPHWREPSWLRGAERVVASHWSVDDAATSELMGSFFENLARTTSGPASTVHYAEALRQARLQVAHNSDHPEWASPYYWAAFTLSGQPIRCHPLRPPSPITTASSRCPWLIRMRYRPVRSAPIASAGNDATGSRSLSNSIALAKMSGGVPVAQAAATPASIGASTIVFAVAMANSFSPCATQIARSRRKITLCPAVRCCSEQGMLLTRMAKQNIPPAIRSKPQGVRIVGIDHRGPERSHALHQNSSP